MRVLRTILFLLLTLQLCIVLPDAGATTLVKVNLAELTRRSPTIVHGTVVSSRSRWNADHSMIVTDVRIRVHATVRGDRVDEVVLVQPGGLVGKMRVDVDGAVPFQLGQEAVLFLSESTPGRLSVTGLSQGRFDVVRRGDSEEKLIPGLSRESLRSEQPVPERAASAKLGDNSVSVDEFLASVKDLVQLERIKDGNR